MTHLQLTLGSERFEVEVHLPHDSYTLASLSAILPWEAELHYAKVAGDEFMAPVPFLVPIENPTQMTSITPGTFCYWPDRPQLCVFYGKVFEMEMITVIGQITHGIDKLHAIGEAVRTQHGSPPCLQLDRR